MLKRMRRSEKGFTLVELLVVIAIISILAAIVAPNAFKAVDKAKVSKVVRDLQAIRSAALAYYVDTGRFPPDDDIYVHQNVPGRKRGWDFLINAAPQIGVNVTGWNGPYLDTWPLNHFWKSSTGAYEEGYQWEGTGPTGAMDFDGDGQNDPCIEMGFVGLSLSEIDSICRKIDREIDDGNILTGNFRKRSASDTWVYYRIVY